MNILKYKKYFFINITSLWSLFFICTIIAYAIAKAVYPPRAPDDFLSPSSLEFAIMLLSGMILFWLYVFTIVEIVIRKYVIKKIFPKFKLTINIKLPKLIINIYNIIFSIGFLSASVFLFLFVVLLLFSILDVYVFN